MGAMVVPNACLVRLQWSRGGQVYANNVFGARKSGAATINQALADSLSAAIMTGFTSSGFASRVHNTIALQAVGIRDVSTANLPEWIGSAAAVPGTESTTNFLPLQVALCVTLRTAMAGRRFRGRTFLGGMTVAGSAGNVADSATATDVRDFVVAVQSAMSAAGLTLAVLSRPVYDPPNSDNLVRAGVATDVTAIVLRDNAWDTQRKRAS